MGSVVVLSTLLLLFHREIALSAFLLIFRPRPRNAAKYAIRLKADGQRPPNLFIHSIGRTSVIGVRHFGLGLGSVLVHRSLWDQFTEGEREALLSWYNSLFKRYTFFQIFFGLINVKMIDRNCLLLGIPSTELISILAQVECYQNSLPSPTTRFLGIIGPPLFGEWPGLRERTENIIQHGTKTKA